MTFVSDYPPADTVEIYTRDFGASADYNVARTRVRTAVDCWYFDNREISETIEQPHMVCSDVCDCDIASNRQ